MKEYVFTMVGTVHAESKAAAEELLSSVCDGVLVDKVRVDRKKDDVVQLAPLSHAIKQAGAKRRARS